MIKLQDIVIISPDVRGFWHGDYFDRSECAGKAAWEAEENWRFSCVAPDGFFTTEVGATEQDAIAEAKDTWPGALIETCHGAAGKVLADA